MVVHRHHSCVDSLLELKGDTCIVFSHKCVLRLELFLNIMIFQIFVSRDGGNKKYSSVLAPGHHESLK